MTPTTQDAYNLFHEGVQALAHVESNGIRIDVPRLDRTIVKVGKRISRLAERLKQDEVWSRWRRRFGGRASLGSRQQLAAVLHEELKHKTAATTRTGKVQVDEKALSRIDLPFVKTYLEVEKLKKLQSTYLKGVRREVVDGLLRPSFNLHLVSSYRSGCSNPNFQNIPIRDKTTGKLIRSCFVPRDGHVLVEVDYGALEFRIAACHWKDEAMVEYASDPSLDIHRDMAAECYMLEPDQVTSEVRFFAKNQFVFPTLYGSYYVNTARNLWNVIGQAGLTTKDGQSLEDHLMMVHGITERTYEDHVKGVERRFNERFPTWSVRKEKWWSKYQQRGWFPLMTGFRCSGVYSRNQLFNIPVQGPAFHILLWSLIELVGWMRKRKMRSMIVGQIHDSIVADVHRDELDDYIGKAREVMADDIRKAWPWIVTPLEVDVEVAETNWYEKRSVE